MLTKLTTVLLILLAAASSVTVVYWMATQGKTMPTNIPPLETEEQKPDSTPSADGELQTATFGGGCFWCTEAVFQRLKGVKEVESGYTGGTTENPTYKDICTGTTGHAEVIRITYDPTVVQYATLLRVFWATHDPTTLNRQGHDVGTQYRSVIFTHSPEQAKIAQEYKDKLEAEKVFDAPIVTEITPAVTYYPAKKYHQNYFRSNPNDSYCRNVAGPKLEKLNKVFADLLAK